VLRYRVRLLVRFDALPFLSRGRTADRPVRQPEERWPSILGVASAAGLSDIDEPQGNTFANASRCRHSGNAVSLEIIIGDR
jgi:hypothetical protein